MGYRNGVWGLPYKGGKQNCTIFQCNALAEHARRAGIDELIDLCGGGGKIALSADREVFRHITYNEYDISVFCLMKMIKNYTTLDWLREELRKITSTQDNYKLFTQALEDVAKAQQEREKGKTIFNKYSLGLQSAILTWGSHNNDRMSPVRTTLRDGESFIRYPDFIPNTKNDGLSSAERSMTRIITRLQPHRDMKNKKYTEAIKLTNMDAFQFLEQKKQRSDLLVYIDPPYVNNGKQDYLISWVVKEHERLINLCKDSKLHIVICYGTTEVNPSFDSGTESLDCYQSLLKSNRWHRYVCNSDDFGYIMPKEGKHAKRSNFYEIMLCNFVIQSEEEKRLRRFH